MVDNRLTRDIDHVTTRIKQMNEHNRQKHNMSPVPDNLIQKFKKTKQYQMEVKFSKKINQFKMYGMSLDGFKKWYRDPTFVQLEVYLNS